MLIIGLMVIALICLAVGLVLPSSAWLVASLIATAGAGYLVWKMRSAIAPLAAGGGSAETARVTHDDGTGSEAYPQAEPLTAGPAVDDTDGADGADRDADRHRVASADETAVIAAIPAPVADDATAVIGAVATSEVGDVWVIDGRPRYHVGSCPIIQGQDAEPIPFDQAVEDGFMPCSLCEPTMAHTGR